MCAEKCRTLSQLTAHWFQF